MEERMVQTFWIWLILLATAWIAAVFQISEEKVIVAMLGCAVFFGLFFLAPIFRQRYVVLTVILIVCLASATAALWPEPNDVSPNPYLLLIYSIIVGKGVFRLPVFFVGCVGLSAILFALLPTLLGLAGWPVLFILIYAVILSVAFAIYRSISSKLELAALERDELLSEYKQLKRSSVDSEEVVRQQERTKIARDMHDSVGHKLTALLMQLEVFRMQSTGETAEKAEMLKRLAKESLEETRHAVKELNQQETVGFQAILHMIRKWEAENYIRIQFSLRQGVLSAPLSNEQSAAIYRAVQEALTNAIRHSSSREVEIEFEAPGGRVFRFEITNPHTRKTSFQEGFGLSAMRDRIEQLGGQLDVLFESNRFIIRGILPLQGRGIQHDKHLNSGGSSDGQAGAKNDDRD